MKPDDLLTYMEVAEVFAKKSKARRLKVGAVAVRDTRILAEGYNGTLPGQDNDCEIEVDGILITKPGVIHGEQNVITKLAKFGTASHGASMFCTHACCTHCASLMISAGFKEFYFRHEYKDNSGLDLLSDNNVRVMQLPKIG